MKNLFAPVAFGAIVAVNAAGNDEGKPADLEAIFNGADAKIDWNQFSPENLGMNLNFDEMSEGELHNIVEAFQKLGLITPEDAESFGASLTDPRMRSMLASVTENWSGTMERILKDPQYLEFLQSFQNNIDEGALSTIVGLKNGLKGAIADATESAKKEGGDE